VVELVEAISHVSAMGFDKLNQPGFGHARPAAFRQLAQHS